MRNVLPCLPPELWILILRCATSSSSTQEYSLPTVSFLSPAHTHSHLHHRLTYYRSIMRRKALMTLVCKDWYTYAQEVLFEFVWISRASQARILAAILSHDGPRSSKGRYMRRLHIETPSLERCCPTDLRIILDCAPRLVVYSDYRSVRRNIYEESCNPRSSPKHLLSALAHPNNSLRRLSWTNYDDVSFPLHMSPMLETTAANLEFLELNLCSTHTHTAAWSLSPSFCLDITLTLPSLRSLKVTLDNTTFAVLSTWTMPSLRNLSVLSADFSYASSGFSDFLKAHGPNLTQLELGHSSCSIEEHYLTTPPSSATPSNLSSIPLATWCPNLVEFICSADAEWNWQNPEWIAPHVLLPTHPTLQFIGIRDIDKRLRDDLALDHHHGPARQPLFRLLEQIGSLVRRQAFPALLYLRDMSWESDLMRRGVASPCSMGLEMSASGHAVGLVHVLKKAVQRAGMDGGLRMLFASRQKKELSEAAAVTLNEETIQVLRFWRSVLECCREGGVWMEDFRGVNVTMRDLRRAEAGKGNVPSGFDCGAW